MIIEFLIIILKLEPWRALLTNFITLCFIEYTFPWAGFKLTTVVVIDTDCIGSCKSTYHMIMTTTAPTMYLYPRPVISFWVNFMQNIKYAFPTIFELALPIGYREDHF